MLNIIVIILRLILVFGDGLKLKPFNMAKMITANAARAVGILVFALFPQQIVFVLTSKFF